MIKRVQLVNSTQQWRANGRYKVNTVVTYLEVDYQNTTGVNSLPSLLTDWIVVSDTQIIDDLVTNSPNKALSANQGVELKKLIDAVVVNMTLFPTTADSDISGYKKMVTSMDDADYDDVAVNIPTGAITTVDVLVSELATDTGVIFGGSGVVNVSLIGKIRKVSGTANGQFYYKVYKRDSLGTETLLATSDVTEIVSSNIYVEFSASAVWSNTEGFVSTDRIVYKFYGSKNGSGSNPSFEFEFGGATPVRSIVPVSGTGGGSPQNLDGYATEAWVLANTPSSTTGAVVNNTLTSNSIAEVLSANRGRVLADLRKYFENTSTKVKGDFYIEDIIDWVKVESGQAGLINPLTGNPIKIWISTFTSTTTNQNIRFSFESPIDGTVQVYPAGAADVSSEFGITPVADFQSNNIKYLRSSFTGNPILFPKITIRLRCTRMGNSSNLGAFTGISISQLTDNYINSVINPLPTDIEEGFHLSEFLDFENTFSSNFSLVYPTSIPVKRTSINSEKVYKTIGVSGLIHGQTYLNGEKRSQLQGKKTVSINNKVTSSVSNIPTINLIRNKSSLPQRSALTNTANGQWIHPDTCVCDTPVGGYTYWQANSCYPYGVIQLEDVELMVSNNGVDWLRIGHPNETDYTDGVTLQLPLSYWGVTSARKNTFMPIPEINKVLEFTDNVGTQNRTIKSTLNHDPAIYYENGYVNIYITYNFALDTTVQSHKYVVCYRTANGVDWEVVRENGTTFPYNETNAQLIFSSTAGVRNHTRYFFAGTGVTIAAYDVCPQIVKSGTNQYHAYYVRRTNGGAIDLIRYNGTSQYTFNWNSYETCTLSAPKFGIIWHFCMRFYGGQFYFMYDGNMCTSTDGLAFTQPNFPFFYKGAQADLYKPSFIVGLDGKIKITHSLQTKVCYNSNLMQNTQFGNNFPNVQSITRTICYTISCEYLSLADIISKGNTLIADAYLDIFIYVKNERTKNEVLHFIPAIRNNFKYKSIDCKRDDLIEVSAYANTRGTGVNEFSGIIIDDRV